jgi:hypothetical protein
MNELEQLCEDYFIELMGKNEDLVSMSFQHFDTDDQAVAPAIVVQAIQKAHRLDGPRGFDVEVTMLYRSTDSTPDDNKKVVGAIRKSVYGAKAGMTAAEGGFGYLNILEETMGGDRAIAKDLKKRTVTVSLIARIEDE